MSGTGSHLLFFTEPPKECVEVVAPVVAFGDLVEMPERLAAAEADNARWHAEHRARSTAQARAQDGETLKVACAPWAHDTDACEASDCDACSIRVEAELGWYAGRGIEGDARLAEAEALLRRVLACHVHRGADWHCADGRGFAGVLRDIDGTLARGVTADAPSERLPFLSGIAEIKAR